MTDTYILELAELYSTLIFKEQTQLYKTYSWFYSYFEEGVLDRFSQIYEKEDLKQEILLFSFSLKDRSKTKKHKDNLQQKLVYFVPRFVRDLVKRETHNNPSFYEGITVSSAMSSDESLDLRSVLYNTKVDVPTYYRYIVYLRYYKELKYSQIADITYQTERTSKNQVVAGRNMYKKAYNI